MKTLKCKTNALNADMNGDELTVVSLFAGCGGSSLGYQMAGFQELLAIDFDEKAVENFKLNFPDVPIWQRNICEVDAKEILNFCKLQQGKLDVLDASPPCQGFSTAGKRQVTDKRNDLFLEFVRLIKELQPKVFIMENVSGLIKGRMKGKFKEIMITLKSLGYAVKCELLNAKYYGVPQDRKRLIWCGVRKDLKIKPSLPKPQTRALMISEVIEDLLNKSQDESIGHIWHDEEKKKTKAYFKALQVKQGQKFAGFAKKYEWNKPVGTLQTPGGSIEIPGHLRNLGCHPLKIRTFSIREYARLQSFPDEFVVLNDLCYGFKLIGNAVPPLMMKAIAIHIRDNILNGKPN
jgi:DNA (cytosine-5)-methyltransferase 1